MISGAAYVVKALQEENVEFLFNYPGAATIDIMDELYKQDQVKVIYLVMSKHWHMLPMVMHVVLARSAFVWLHLVQVQQISLLVLLQLTLIVFQWYVLPVKLICP